MNDLGAQPLRQELGASLQSSGSTVFLTPSQTDLIAQACMVAVDESARFLCGRVRHSLAEALREMGKPHEAMWIENGTPINDNAG